MPPREQTRFVSECDAAGKEIFSRNLLYTLSFKSANQVWCEPDFLARSHGLDTNISENIYVMNSCLDSGCLYVGAILCMYLRKKVFK